MKTKPWMMLVAMMAGWLNRQQQEIIEYLNTGKENHIIFTVKWIGLTFRITQARAKVRASNVRLVLVWSSLVLRSLS